MSASIGPRQPSRNPTNSWPWTLDALADDGADHRVEPGAVSTAGQHADSHIGRLARPAPARPGDFGHLRPRLCAVFDLSHVKEGARRADPSQVRRMQESTRATRRIRRWMVAGALLAGLAVCQPAAAEPLTAAGIGGTHHRRRHRRRRAERHRAADGRRAPGPSGDGEGAAARVRRRRAARSARRRAVRNGCCTRRGADLHPGSHRPGRHRSHRDPLRCPERRRPGPGEAGAQPPARRHGHADEEAARRGHEAERHWAAR